MVIGSFPQANGSLIQDEDPQFLHLNLWTVISKKHLRLPKETIRRRRTLVSLIWTSFEWQ